MTHFKAFILRLDAVFDHALAERAHRGHGVVKDLIAEIAGAAVKRGHLRKQLRGLQTFLRAHAHGAAGGRDHDNIGKLSADGIHHHAEAFAILRGRAIVLPDMDVQNGRARVIRAAGLRHHFLYRVGNEFILRLGDLCAADGGGDDEFFHGAALSARSAGRPSASRRCHGPGRRPRADRAPRLRSPRYRDGTG